MGIQALKAQREIVALWEVVVLWEVVAIKVPILF